MRKLLLFSFFLYFTGHVSATHIRGGQITTKVISGNTCQITLRGYAKVSSAVKWEGGTLDFGDGSSSITLPGNDFYLPTLDPDIGIYLFTINHTFPGPGFYTVSYFDRNLNAGILNMDDSVDTPFYLESGLILDPLLKTSPVQFSTDPIFYAPIGKPYSFSTAPIDTAYIYEYELVTPEAINYLIPETFQINAQTGLVTWDTKFKGSYLTGEYYFSIRVNQYDKQRHYLGYVIRNFTLFLSDEKSVFSKLNPITDPLGKIVTIAPNQTKLRIILSDSVNIDSLSWRAYYDASLSENINFTQYDSSAMDRKIKVGVLTFTSSVNITRDLPYTIVFRGISFVDSFESATADISFFLFTKDVDLPVITKVKIMDGKVFAFPNPCHNELQIAGETKFDKVVILNEAGQPIFTTRIDDNKINTSQLSPGLYFIILKNENAQSNLRIIKK